MAEFLGRQGRTKEALDLCEPLWKPEPTPAVATISVNILQGRDDPAQFGRVEGWLKSATQAETRRPGPARHGGDLPLDLRPC